MNKNTYQELPDVLTVLENLGVELPSRISNTNISVKCPFCNDKKRHLRFSLETTQYYCPRCSASGNILTFYAQMRNISNSDARKELAGNNFSSAEISEPRRNIVLPQVAPLASAAHRHSVYMALLELLSLSPQHRQDLLDRGMTEEQILHFGFKSMPEGRSYSIPQELMKKGLSLEGVPGFYKDRSGKWRFRSKDTINGKPIHSGMVGYLIPVCDSKRRIQGFQIRREKGADPKYIWMSTADYDSGCGAKNWCHYVGDALSSGKIKEVILTEGALKADVIHALSGYSVIAIMGVNATSELPSALERMKQCGVKYISLAFDMDMYTNKNVMNAFHKVRTLLLKNGFLVRTLSWTDHKGLDDYLLHRTKQYR